MYTSEYSGLKICIRGSKFSKDFDYAVKYLEENFDSLKNGDKFTIEVQYVQTSSRFMGVGLDWSVNENFLQPTYLDVEVVNSKKFAKLVSEYKISGQLFYPLGEQLGEILANRSGMKSPNVKVLKYG